VHQVEVPAAQPDEELAAEWGGPLRDALILKA
jgi:hypothetical protein